MRSTLQTLALSGFLCMGLGSGAALAQDATTPPVAQQGGGHWHGAMSPDEQLAHMTKQLDLTADQQTQIKPLLEAHRDQAMQIRQDQSLSREDRMTKMKSANDDTHAKIEAVLNDAQKAKFEKLVERRQEHMEHNNGPVQPQQ